MNSRKEAVKHIDKKLLWRVRMYMAITFVMLCIVAYQTIRYDVNILIPIGCMIVWSIIWLVAGRMHKMSRDTDANKIVARMDRTGIIILVLYLCISFARRRLLGMRVHGPALLDATLAVVVGTMIGRLITMRYGIKKILLERMEELFQDQ